MSSGSTRYPSKAYLIVLAKEDECDLAIAHGRQLKSLLHQAEFALREGDLGRRSFTSHGGGKVRGQCQMRSHLDSEPLSTAKATTCCTRRSGSGFSSILRRPMLNVRQRQVSGWWYSVTSSGCAVSKTSGGDDRWWLGGSLTTGERVSQQTM